MRVNWHWALPIFVLLIVAGLFVALRSGKEPPARLLASQETHGELTLTLITPKEMGPHAPEDLLSYAFELKNSSDRPHTYEIAPESPEGWRALSQYRPVALQPGEAQKFFASWLIPPWMPAGIYPLAISIRSEEDRQTGRLVLQVPVRATPRPRMLVEKDRPQVVAGSSEALNITVENRGNAPGSFEMTVEAPPGWQIVLSPKTLTLEPQRQASIDAKIYVPQGAAWGSYSLTVKARSSGFENELSLTVSVVPGP
ncbi:MAG: hypothetical protein A2Z21_03855 [Candidatus Fraserbacteria bacterium RBG_16_55_9]|uniref:Alpha-galactosidase NEW3 domain-containing protein n=1 Tax=Fraserbacteria sp. (strain RBG_16_55_9) TaxID=1817864 RepID=A0A1F5UX76_FRAXR|nr:MAG: hypothetical protein A2Z21_03855 [Candidatus Fraserbacteria bacterium RBG_16_55_9]